MNRRHFFLPVNTGYATDGEPSERLIKFYSSRSGHGLYCAIVGNVIFPGGHGTNSSCAKISASNAWQDLAKAIESKGAKPGIQLSSTWNNYRGITEFEACQNEFNNYKILVDSLTQKDVQIIFKNLRIGIELSVKSGFKHIQIHAAHGYIFSILLDNFSKFSIFSLNQLLKISTDLNSENIESSLRISLISGNQKIDKSRECLVHDICELPFSFIDVSSGYYNINKHLIYPVCPDLLAARSEATIELALHFPSREFILSGKSQGIWRSNLPPNVHIGIARDLIANPHFLRDYRSECRDCMQCHYHSRGATCLFCGNWLGDN